MCRDVSVAPLIRFVALSVIFGVGGLIRWEIHEEGDSLEWLGMVLRAARTPVFIT